MHWKKYRNTGNMTMLYQYAQGHEAVRIGATIGADAGGEGTGVLWFCFRKGEVIDNVLRSYCTGKDALLRSCTVAAGDRRHCWGPMVLHMGWGLDKVTRWLEMHSVGMVCCDVHSQTDDNDHGGSPQLKSTAGWHQVLHAFWAVLKWITIVSQLMTTNRAAVHVL